MSAQGPDEHPPADEASRSAEADHDVASDSQDEQVERVSLHKAGPPRAAGDDIAGDVSGNATTSESSVTPEAPAGRRRRHAKQKANAPRRKAPWWELPALVLLAILIAIVVKSFVVQPFYIPSASMEHTLHGSNGKNDRILVNKVIYDFRDPEPGDIVVFNAPPGWDNEPGTTPPSNPILRAVRGFGQLIGFVPPDGEVLVKRVIATGGQTVFGDTHGVYVCSRDCTRTPNPSAMPSSYRHLSEPFVYESGPDTKADFGPITVPTGRLWVMGDHRDNSADSRYHCGADGSEGTDDSSCNTKASTVPISDVIGKAFVVAWPPSDWRTLGTPSTFENAAAATISPNALPFVTLVPLFLMRRRRRRR